MAEKLHPGTVNLIMHIVEALDENGELGKIADLLREKGYLDKEEETPKASIADEEWEYFGALPSNLNPIYRHRVIQLGEPGESAGIAWVAYKEDSTAIAALPNLVKACLYAIDAFEEIEHFVLPTPEAKTIRAVEEQIKKALEKAGEIL